jgi:hypothetical protein
MQTENRIPREHTEGGVGHSGWKTTGTVQIMARSGRKSTSTPPAPGGIYPSVHRVHGHQRWGDAPVHGAASRRLRELGDKSQELSGAPLNFSSPRCRCRNTNSHSLAVLARCRCYWLVVAAEGGARQSGGARLGASPVWDLWRLSAWFRSRLGLVHFTPSFRPIRPGCAGINLLVIVDKKIAL